MKRFNYLADGNPVPFPALGTTIAIDNRIRGPLAALVATVVFTGCASLFQLARLHAAQRAYTVISARFARANMSLDAVRVLRAHVDAQTRVAEQIGAIRRVSLMHAAQLAWIGNSLPADTWLHTLRYENGSYSLEGTSRRVSAVGSALLALRDDRQAAIPQLVSLRDDAGDGPAHVHYTLRLATQP